MAKTFVVNGGNFSAVAFDKVQIKGGGSIPCKGLTVQSTLKIDAIGISKALSYVVKPSNCTDEITWETSNPMVAIVDNGSVMSVGIGQATITARCGTYSAQCTVNVEAVFAAQWMIGTHVNLVNGNYLYGSNLPSSIACYSESGALPMNGKLAEVYPVSIPNGTKKISIVVDGVDAWLGCAFANSTTEGSIAGHVNNMGGFMPSSSVGVKNSTVVDVPDGANCFSASVRLESGNAADSSLAGKVTIKYLAE